MSIAISLILREAVDELSDAANVRWTLPELVRYLNDGVRQTAILRPDAYTTTSSHALVAGARQTLPAQAMRLVDIPRNTAGKQRAVRPATREMLDAHDPAWQSMRSTAEIQHFIYDQREPLVFYVYPPAALGASVEVTYSFMPPDAAGPAAGAVMSDLDAVTVAAPITFIGALTHYVLYRAWARESETASALQRATGHYQLFLTNLGLEGEATVSIGPTSGANPNKNSAKTGT